MTTFRKAKEIDIPGLVDIEKSCFDPLKYDLTSRSQFRYLITKANAELWLACRDNEIAGYATILYRRKSNGGRVYSVAVLPRYQNKGIGKALLLCCEKMVAKKSLLSIVLEVRRDDIKGRQIYESLGYKKMSEIADYYPDHCACIKMKKTINGLH